jgi:hypothetical protein
MALTAGTVWAMAPYGGRDQHVAPVMEFGATASETLKKGDVMVVASGRASRDNSSPAVDIIIGICASAKTVASSVTADDVILIHPAFPGCEFEGNIASANGTDTTGVYATHVLATADIVEADVASNGLGDEVAMLDEGGTAKARTLRYGRQKDGTLGRDSGTGKTNPRVVFVFNTSIFARLS